MQSNTHHESQVGYIGLSGGNRCGYCGSSTGSQAFYLKAVTISPLHYQKLVDIGWRRSGHLLYRPNLKNSCCIQYTIRLDATEFKPSREHRKVLHRWEKFVVGQSYTSECAIRYPKTKEEKKRLATEFDLQKCINGPEHSFLRIPPEPHQKFEVTIEQPTFTREKFAIFRNYQQTVHNEGVEEISEGGFQRFLCNSPLQSTPAYPADGSKRLGSFHQMYRLDGRLIAIAILDFLPWCVSGVYFIYHSDFSKWGFGKLGACREAALAVEEGYKYYYMGYYIHTCPKMRYKGQYQPSYILDPENNEWNLLDDAMERMMTEKVYFSPSVPNAVSLCYPRTEKGLDEGEDKDETEIWACEMPGILSQEEVEIKVDLGRVRVFVPNAGHVKASTIVQFRNRAGAFRMAIKQFAAVVGPELATQIELRFDL